MPKSRELVLRALYDLIGNRFFHWLIILMAILKLRMLTSFSKSG